MYPNAPIIFVAAELRYVSREPLDPAGLMRAQKILKPDFPLYSEEVAAPDAPQSEGLGKVQWSTRDKRTVVTFDQESVAVKTTDYLGYAALQRLLLLAIAGVQQCRSDQVVERFGLRYVDEIRVPSEDASEKIDWAEWIDPRLTGLGDVLGVAGFSPVVTQGRAFFSDSRDRFVVFRYGSDRGFAVDSTEELRRPLPVPGEFFLLDIDSVWLAADSAFVWGDGTMFKVMDSVHAPVHDFFENSITERLREEVLRRD